eukprot:m.8905 g.8905  ORF g.8905 m.8905 type:complete len:202 (+) comp3367_c0_seq1:101-706(+)
MGASFGLVRAPAQGTCYDLPRQYWGAGSVDGGTSVVLPKRFQEAGKRYHEAQASYWATLAHERKKSIMAKNKFHDDTLKHYQRRWPDWSEEDISDLRDQFTTYDVNRDGIISIEELSTVLDDLGDTSGAEERSRQFALADTDGSGGVDFEEFLELLQRFIHGESDPGSGFGKLYTQSQATVQSNAHFHNLTLRQQLVNGLI